MGKLIGRVVFVTGAARGIGAGTALAQQEQNQNPGVEAI